MKNFADELGPGYLNLVLRRISHELATTGDAYLKSLGIRTPAKSTSVLSFLARQDLASMADIAAALSYTHQGIAKIVSELESLGLVKSSPSATDQRKRCLSLTKAGREDFKKIDLAAKHAEKIFQEIFDEIGSDLFENLRDFEKALARRSLQDRLFETPPVRKKKIG